jgi:tetratricopeptide (TPR) repeat protein
VIPGLVLLALTSGAELSAAAASSPRPAVCRPSGVGPESTIWSRARPVSVARFCAALARGFVELGTRPDAALELARKAQALDATQPAARLLEGRALFRLGRSEEAWKLLKPYLEAGAPPLDDAESLFDVSRAALSTGALEQAERGYRMVVARGRLLGSEDERRIATIEAASLTLARGPAGIDVALSYLAEARAVPLAGERDLVLALTALALHRAGKQERARALARESDGPWDLESLLSPTERTRVSSLSLEIGTDDAEPSPGPLARSRIMLLDGELHAAIAVLAEGRDNGLARAHLRAFLSSPRGQGPFAEHARKALSALGGRRL